MGTCLEGMWAVLRWARSYKAPKQACRLYPQHQVAMNLKVQLRADLACSSS